MKLNANVVSLQQDLAKSRTNELLLEKSKKQVCRMGTTLYSCHKTSVCYIFFYSNLLNFIFSVTEYTS